MLTGSSITLRCWAIEDAPDLQRLKNDIGIQTQLMGTPKPSSINKIIEWLKNKDNEDSAVFFVIARKSDNLAIGYIQLTVIDKFNLSGYLGICLAKDYWGTGCAKEALELFSGYAISILSLRKILLLVSHDNDRAIGFYLKLGFVVVGRLKKHQLVKGVWTDVIMMERVNVA